MTSRSTGEESRRDFDSGGWSFWSEDLWDESRGAYYRRRSKANGEIDYYYPDDSQAEYSSIPRTSTSSNDYSYSASDERESRSREPYQNEPRRRGHTVSPGPQGTPPPPPPPPEETPSSYGLAQSISGLSNLSMSSSSDQPYDSYTTQPKQSPQTKTTHSNTYKTSNTVADEQTGPRKLEVELNDWKVVTAFTAESDVSLISEKLAGTLQLKEKSIDQKPRLEGEEKALKLKKQSYVEVRCGNKARKERVYIVPKGQGLREHLLLKQSTIESLAPATPSSSTKNYYSIQAQQQAPFSPTPMSYSKYSEGNYDVPGSSIPTDGYPSPPPSESSYTPAPVSSEAYLPFTSAQASPSSDTHRRSSGKDETRRRKR